MVKFTVDGPARLLIVKTGITAVDVKIDLYSDAKEDWAANESLMRFPFPFRTVGGDPIGGGKFFGDGYFLTNGWKIRPHEADHELVLTGNLFLDSGETPGIFVPTIGAFTVLATIERSSDAIGISTSGGGIYDRAVAGYFGLIPGAPSTHAQVSPTKVEVRVPAEGISVDIVEAPAGTHVATRL